jgi:hypothetical protein
MSWGENLLMVISLNHIPYNVELGVEVYILTKIQWGDFC